MGPALIHSAERICLPLAVGRVHFHSYLLICFILFQIINHLQATIEDPVQTPQYAVSDKDLPYCLCPIKRTICL